MPWKGAAILILLSISTEQTRGFGHMIHDDHRRTAQQLSKEFRGAAEGHKDRVLGDFINHLPEQQRIYLAGNNLTETNIDDVIRNSNETFWNIIGNVKLISFGKTGLERVRSSGNVPERVKENVKTILAANMTEDDAVRELRSFDPRTRSKAEARALMRNIRDPAHWNATTMIQYRDIVFSEDLFALGRIKNKDVLKQILNELNNCDEGRRRQCGQLEGRGKGETIAAMKAFIQEKIYGEPSSWDQESFTQIYPEYLTAAKIREVDPEVLMTKMDKFAYMKMNKPEAREVIKSFLKTKDLENMNLDQIEDTINELHNLKEFITVEDLPASALERRSIYDLVVRNAEMSVKNGRPNAQNMKTILRRMLKNHRVEDLNYDVLKNIDSSFLAYMNPRMMKTLVRTDKLNENILKDVSSQLSKFKGLGYMANLRAIAGFYEKKLEKGEDIDLSSLPAAIKTNLPLKRFKEFNSVDMKRFAWKIEDENIEITPAQKSAILEKLSVSEITNLPADYMVDIPVSKLREDSSSLKKVAAVLPSNSPAGHLVALKEFPRGDPISANSLKQKRDSIRYLSGSEVSRMKSEEILDILRTVSEGEEPGFTACRELKTKLVEWASKELLTTDEGTVLGMLNTVDIERMPVCVIAAFGPGPISSLTPDQKLIVAQRLGALSNPAKSVAGNTRKAIVMEALKHMDTSEGITPGHLIFLGNASLDIPPGDMKRMDSATSRLMLYKFLNLTADLRPCMDEATKSAISDLIFKVKGPYHTWDSVHDICCYLDTIPTSSLNQVPADVLSSCTCDELPSDAYRSYTEAKEVMCMKTYGSDYKDRRTVSREMRQLQGDRVLHELSSREKEGQMRVKRATEDNADLCDKADLEVIPSIAEIRDTRSSVVMSCLASLGDMDLHESLAQEVVGKIREAKGNDLKGLTAQELADMKGLYLGLSYMDISKLPKLEAGAFDDAVAQLGSRNWGLSEDVLTNLAYKVTSEWKSPSNMTTQDIYAVNQLICGFKREQITMMNKDKLREALPALRNLDGCESNTTLTYLAEKLTAGVDVTNWDKAEVAELGVVASGLAPEVLSKLPDTSLEGLTPNAMMMMPPERAKVLKTTQIQHLPLETAQSTTDQQQKEFTPEMKAALIGVLTGSYGSGAPVGTEFMMALILNTLMFLYLSSNLLG